MTHVRAIFASGFIWMAVGASLLYKGLTLIVHCFEMRSYGALFKTISKWAGSAEQAVLFLVCIGLFLGLLKGRLILAKSVRRVMSYILALPLPLKVSTVFPKSYLITICVMMCLGMSMRFLPITDDVRGLVDVAVGSGLMNGALLYFRHAMEVKTGVYR